MFDRMRPRPSGRRSTTAAAVSSHVVSMPRTIIVRLSAKCVGWAKVRNAPCPRGGGHASLCPPYGPSPAYAFHRHYPLPITHVTRLAHREVLGAIGFRFVPA